MQVTYDPNLKIGNINTLTRNELQALVRVIEGASLPDKQRLYDLKERIKEVVK